MEKILFADDDVEIQNIVTSILTKEGYEVVSAKEGKEALGLAKSAKPDLIILDYQMPGMDGIEVCRNLKKDSQTEPIPVIMVTAYSEQKQKSLDVGAMDFVVKPIEKTDLVLRVRSILAVKHINNELQKIISYIDKLERH